MRLTPSSVLFSTIETRSTSARTRLSALLTSALTPSARPMSSSHSHDAHRHRAYNSSTHQSNRNFNQRSYQSRRHNEGTTPGTELNVHDELAFIEELGDRNDKRSVRIAVQGCSHGCIDKIYEILEEYQRQHGPSYAIDLLLCCGDFQSLRNTTDFDTISVPRKYMEMGSFYHYYSGAKTAPILTLFIGGNHEASGYLQELYYGGWVAPNMYYLGAAGVVSFRGLRIAGLSGIYHASDYNKGRFEEPPYTPSSLRSVYHYRNVEVSRIKCLSKNVASQPMDIFMSHDWPRGIERFGNTKELLRKKAYFAQEIRDNNLGSPPNEELLHLLKPRWWFSAHLHVKFHAMVVHAHHTKIPKAHRDKGEEDVASTETSFVGLPSSHSLETGHEADLTDLMTQFLSLDKCLPRRRHLQVLNIPCPHDVDTKTNTLCYDIDWLCILQKTHPWTVKSNNRHASPDVSTVSVSDQDRETLLQRIRAIRSWDESQRNILMIPQNFVMTVLPHGSIGSEYRVNGGRMIGNPQTDSLLHLLGLDHIITVPFRKVTDDLLSNDTFATSKRSSTDENEIDLCL